MKIVGKYSFIHATSTQAAKQFLKDGFDGVTFNQDAVVLTNAFKEAVAEIKAN